MNKKKIIIIILVIIILISIYMLYNTFAINSAISNNDNDIYTINLTEDNNTITIPSNSSKTVYYHIKNTNKGTVRYAIGYNSDTNIEVKIYNDSIDKETDLMELGSNKFIKLYLNNSTNADSSVTLSTILGYEHGGDLIVSDNITLIEEVYTPITSTPIAEYITNLYTEASKSTVENNSITYNTAPSVSLMNDRLGGTTTSLDGGNIRYYGASPNNYIYFNCSDYSNQTSDTCEPWRIIGVFDGKLKIMRNEIIGTYSWDTSESTINSGYGINEWSQADLMKLLNPGYESESVGGSLYYNSGSGTCYSDSKNSTTSCDFTSTGIKNDETRNKIATVVWNTGGWNTSEVYSNVMYEKERGTTVVVPGTTCSGTYCNDTVTRQTTWTGKIALAYPSDYGYATDFTKCSNTLSNYSDSTDSYACRTNDWMYSILGASSWGWLMAPYSDLAYFVWYVYSAGSVYNYYVAYDAYGVAPTLFLNSSEVIYSGTGSSTDPYKLF